jgi:hypothetical protein
MHEFCLLQCVCFFERKKHGGAPHGVLKLLFKRAKDTREEETYSWELRRNEAKEL